MNQKSTLRLMAIASALCFCTLLDAQVVPPKPTQIADLVISSLSAKIVGSNRIQYSWTITNVGTGSVNLDGPTASNADNLKVQAFVSKDTVFGNVATSRPAEQLSDLRLWEILLHNSPGAELLRRRFRQTSRSYPIWC